MASTLLKKTLTSGSEVISEKLNKKKSQKGVIKYQEFSQNEEEENDVT
jgi:hypothetical protein